MYVGDVVVWDSQSNASCVRKFGTVVAVVPAGLWPAIPHDLRPGYAFGGPRKHESYLVQLQGTKYVYWPRVSKLVAVSLFHRRNRGDRP